MSLQLRELRSRKAKFGFDVGTLTLEKVIPLGRLMEDAAREFDSTRYIIQESGYNQPDVKIYTDDPEVAEWFRNFKY